MLSPGAGFSRGPADSQILGSRSSSERALFLDIPPWPRRTVQPSLENDRRRCSADGRCQRHHCMGGETLVQRRGSHGNTNRTVTVGFGNVQQTVTASGTVEPTTTSNLSFGAAGQVTAVKVTQGQKVHAGQQLP